MRFKLYNAQHETYQLAKEALHQSAELQIYRDRQTSDDILIKIIIEHEGDCTAAASEIKQQVNQDELANVMQICSHNNMDTI